LAARPGMESSSGRPGAPASADEPFVTCCMSAPVLACDQVLRTDGFDGLRLRFCEPYRNFNLQRFERISHGLSPRRRPTRGLCPTEMNGNPTCSRMVTVRAKAPIIVETRRDS